VLHLHLHTVADIFVGIDILADRLFGPQPFAALYVCFWEINVGSVKGVFSTSHGRALQSALDAFVTNYKDPMNAPAAEFALPLTPIGMLDPLMITYMVFMTS
jgi:hypothetical protein